MNPAMLREFVQEEWAKVTRQLEASGTVFAGGPAGIWVTVCLNDEAGPIRWLHFRLPAATIEMARSDDDTGSKDLVWEAIAPGDIAPLLQDFAKGRSEKAYPPSEFRALERPRMAA